MHLAYDIIFNKAAITLRICINFFSKNSGKNLAVSQKILANGGYMDLTVIQLVRILIWMQLLAMLVKIRSFTMTQETAIHQIISPQMYQFIKYNTTMRLEKVTPGVQLWEHAEQRVPNRKHENDALLRLNLVLKYMCIERSDHQSLYQWYSYHAFFL